MNHWVTVIIAIEVCFALALVAAVLTKRVAMIFAAGFNVMAPVVALHFSLAQGAHPRLLIGAAMAAIYLIRLNWVILVQTQNTAMAKLDDKLPQPTKIGLAFALAHGVGLAYCLPFYYIALDATPLGVADGLAILVYAIGTWIHAAGDHQKLRFKRRPDAPGKLLDTGLWSLCRHPNYFGDFVLYVGFAVLAQNLYAWICPLFNLLQYLFDAIPKNEQWAAEKYGAQWQAYKQRTPMFFPRPTRRKAE